MMQKISVNKQKEEENAERSYKKTLTELA